MSAGEYGCGHESLGIALYISGERMEYAAETLNHKRPCILKGFWHVVTPEYVGDFGILLPVVGTALEDARLVFLYGL